MRFLDHDHREGRVLCGWVEETGGRKDEGRDEKSGLYALRWKEARGSLQEGGGTWPLTKGESEKIKIK
jgi:hypothetical protein